MRNVSSGAFLFENRRFSQVMSRRKYPKIAPASRRRRRKAIYGTGLTKAQKITEITFDEKESLIHIRTHNTDLKNRLAAYAAQHSAECRQLDADPDTGCMEFTIRKGRLSFRLTAPYSEKRKRKASEAAKRNGFTRKP